MDCLQACPCTFSPEVLQAGALKGLKATQPALDMTRSHTNSLPSRAYRLCVGVFAVVVSVLNAWSVWKNVGMTVMCHVSQAVGVLVLLLFFCFFVFWGGG